jgi:uncharacterized protein YcaQ
MPRTITAASARHVLARVHGLDPSRQKNNKEGTLAVLMRHQCIQSDPIDAAGRNADLTLQSRVVDYRQQHLLDLLYNKRRLFEYFCKMLSIMPVELYPVFRHKMEAFWREKRIVSFFRKHKKETKLVLKALEKGPVSSRELVDMGRMEWGWGHRTNVSNIILTRLWVSGKAMIYSRNGAAKYYALPEEVIPESVLNVDPPRKVDDVLEITKIIVNASRLVIAGGSPEQWYEVGKTKTVGAILERLEMQGDVFSIQLEESKEKFYVPVADREEWDNPRPPADNYVRFLAPLDPMLWSRRVFRAVYGREYYWEVYKKAKDRVYGYYCLPVIFNNEYVGLVDPFFRKNDKVLQIRNFHILKSDISHSRFLRALNHTIKDFCSYLGAEKIEIDRAPLWTKDALSLI